MPCDYIFCPSAENKALLIAWGVANYPDPEAADGYAIPGSVGTGWAQVPTYRLREAGEDENGFMQYERDPDHSSFFFPCVWYDEDVRDSLAAEGIVTIHENKTVADMVALYPDHTAFNNTIGHIAE